MEVLRVKECEYTTLQALEGNAPRQRLLCKVKGLSESKLLAASAKEINADYAHGEDLNAAENQGYGS
ncbi:hypothetical protein ACFOLF_29250 [Paenibacillus sepulcri]|uniref:Uncharacterized protein n=1 Tax=Paenibacillus sepulcri TaxID=359917 RepID=A0ABS7BZG0_9BACL|nr:hypothetical protein [Paenibacillus sepulcri]